MVGYTPSLSAAVWVGNDNPNVPIENAAGQIVYGAGLPGAIWQQFMDTALAGTPEEDLPDAPRIRGDTGNGVPAPETQAPPTQSQPTQPPAPTATEPPAPTTPEPATPSGPSTESVPPPPVDQPPGGEVGTGTLGGTDGTAGTDSWANGEPAPAAPTTQPQPTG
jgi:membrane peptidoglycan carboxypeptidase